MLGKINSFLNKYLFIINPVGLIIGIIFAKYFGWLKTITTFLVAVVTLCGTVFIGLADFKSVIKKPKALFLSWFASHVFWASFVFLVGKLLFRGNTDLILGLVLVFAIPCAITSTIWANIYDGNNALSIVLVVFDTVLDP